MGLRAQGVVEHMMLHDGISAVSLLREQLSARGLGWVGTGGTLVQGNEGGVLGSGGLWKARFECGGAGCMGAYIRGFTFLGELWGTWEDARPGGARTRERCSCGARKEFAALWGRSTEGEGGRGMGALKGASWRKLGEVPKRGPGAGSRRALSGGGKRGSPGACSS